MQNDLDTMKEIYMMTVLILKITRDTCPLPNWDPDKTEFKVDNMVLLKNHANLAHLILNTNPVSESVNGYLIKHSIYKIV